MGKLIYSMMVSLDGFIETRDREIDWIIIDEEIHRFANDEAREMDAFLYGRRLYEVMAAYWPTADADPSASAVEVDFARIWKPKPKIVFSTTLPEVGWNSRLVRDDAVRHIAMLKHEFNGPLSIGGPTLAAAALQRGLVDEFRIFQQPVVLGGGTPYLPSLDSPVSLQLVETRTFASGVVHLRYVRP